MTGETSYRPRARDRMHKKSSSLELFGIARDVDLEQSTVFRGLIKAIPRFSDYNIDRRRIKQNPSQKLLNRGLVSSVISTRRKGVEQKDIWAWEDQIVNAVNGRGHQEIPLNLSDLEPFVVNSSRGKHIGSFAVRKESEFYDQLYEANVIALKALKCNKRADSTSSRASLRPRIDVFVAKNRKVALDTIEHISDAMTMNPEEMIAKRIIPEGSMIEGRTVILHPAKGYHQDN